MAGSSAAPFSAVASDVLRRLRTAPGFLPRRFPSPHLPQLPPEHLPPFPPAFPPRGRTPPPGQKAGPPRREKLPFRQAFRPRPRCRNSAHPRRGRRDHPDRTDCCRQTPLRAARPGFRQGWRRACAAPGTGRAPADSARGSIQALPAYRAASPLPFGEDASRGGKSARHWASLASMLSA